MDIKEIKKKSYELSETSLNNDDLAKINDHAIKPLTLDDVFTFKVALCSSDIDRVHDKMSNEFLDEIAEATKGLTGLKDHNWDVDSQIARLYDTEIETSDELDEFGDKKKQVIGKAYTLRKYSDYIDKINSGIMKEASISFNSVGDTCSICGAVTHKGNDDIAVCPNGHVMGKTYDNKICYNRINKLGDSYEWSLVAVPCQKNSGIKNKSLINGGIEIMKKSKYIFEKLVNSKAFEKVDEATKKELEEVIESDDVDVSEEDVKKLISENETLKNTVETLTNKINELEESAKHDKLESIVDSAVSKLNPLTETVKKNIMRDIGMEGMKIADDGTITGLDDAIAKITEEYKGLINIEDIDDNDDEKEVIEKSVKHNSGVGFGIDSTKKKNLSNAKVGIRIV